MFQFTCDRPSFRRAFRTVSKGTSPKTNIEELECVRMTLTGNRLEMTGYDLEIGIQFTLEVRHASGEGEFAVKPDILQGFVDKCKADDITIAVDDNFKVHLTCGATSLEIAGMSAECYPTLPQLDQTTKLSVPQNVLSNMIQQTIFSVATNEARPVLTGVSFKAQNGELMLTSMDSYRIAISKTTISTFDAISFVVPKKTLNEVMGMFQDDAEEGCTISICERNVLFQCNGYTLFSKLLEGEFPDVTRMIPNSASTTVKIAVNDLVDSFDRCVLLMDNKCRVAVKCIFSGEDGEKDFEIICETGKGKLQESVLSKITGDDLTIGVDARYFIDAAKHSSCDEISIMFTGPQRPIKVLPPSGDDFTFVLMPMQLK